VPLSRFVFERAAALGDAPALVDGASGRALSFREVADGVRAVAAGLRRRGFRKGDVCAIFCPNLPEYALAFHGVASAGGVNTTVNALYVAEEVGAQQRDSGARFLLTVPALLGRARAAAAGSAVEEIFVVGEADGATPFWELLRGGGAAGEVELDPRVDPVALPYSSGTTGLPKGVRLSHRNLVANLCQLLPIHRFAERSRLVGVLPFFHIYGQTVIMNLALRSGATVVTMPRFELEAFLGLLERHRAARVHVAPPMVLALARHPLVDRYDLSGLGQVFSGAAPLAAELERACSERIGCPVVQGYGLTETSPVTHVTPDDVGAARPGSVGPPAPGTECRIVEPDSGADLQPGQTGEVWIRGPQVMSGYLNDPEATARTLTEGGWLRTSDLAYADQDGYLYIVRPAQGADQVQGLSGAAGAARGAAARAPSRRRRGRRPEP
jgi:acyl-CoA synthetase (AMP-forming)/AMP-acid ligase II